MAGKRESRQQQQHQLPNQNSPTGRENAALLPAISPPSGISHSVSAPLTAYQGPLEQQWQSAATANQRQSLPGNAIRSSYLAPLLQPAHSYATPEESKNKKRQSASTFTLSSGESEDVHQFESGEYSRYAAFPSASRSSLLDQTSTFEGDETIEPEFSPYRSSFMPTHGKSRSRQSMSFTQGEMAQAATTEALLWDEKNSEKDDYLHNPSAYEYDGRQLPILTNGARLSPNSRHFRPYSLRGIVNVIGLMAIVCALVGVFCFWPVGFYISQIRHTIPLVGWNIGGINASGQVPEIQNFPSMIDSATPQSAKTRKGHDGKNYVLVFSDEFNTPGRTFYPGDDPFWEAVDLNYWATHNYEWCDPSALITEGGDLRITMTEEPIHDLNFKSGFLQSWNKFCYSDQAYIEVNVSLPGNAQAQGFWPGIWTMGNLGRAGYGATNDGTWPYSYDSCDVGTQPNQTNSDGTTPDAAKSSGLHDYGGELSWLPGQRLSACTCKGDDHPGPNNKVGRGAPEIDILEAQVDYHGYGTASQSVQLAPFDAGYAWNNASGVGWNKWRDDVILNEYKGSITQEAASGVAILDAVSYDGNQYQTFGYEYQSGGSDGYITWTIGGEKTWTLNGVAFAPNSETQVGQRLISQEPMYIMLNLFISSKFQGNPDFGRLQFPATMFIDYVRVYQPVGHINVGCNPSGFPTADYINRHLPAYTNPNYTTWEQSGAHWPRNSRQPGGCSTARAGP